MCKNKVNEEERELKSVKMSGGMLRPTNLAVITENALKSRMRPFDYLVKCAMYLHEGNIRVEKPESSSDNDNRQTFIKKKVQEYVAQADDYREIQRLKIKTLDAIDSKKIDYSDPFHATNMDGDIDELHYELAAIEATLRDYDRSGEGLLLDISKLLSNKLVWPLDMAGNDTCFTLMTTFGTVTVPLKIVQGEIWMGSLPSKSVVYLNGKKVPL